MKWNTKRTDDCNDQVEVMMSPEAAENQSENCAVELDYHQTEQSQDDFHPVATAALFAAALVIAIAPGLIQLSLMIL